jgi:type IV pilus assembly protein PilO
VTATRWRIAGIAAALLILVGSWFALVSPTLQSAAALDVETASQQAASAALESRISLLKKQSEELPAQEAKLAGIQQQMPPTPALPTLIRNLTTVAENANVTVSSVTPGRPAPVEQPAPPAPPPSDTADEEGTEGEEDAETADSGSDVDSASTASEPAATPQSAMQVQSMTLNITACGTFAQLRSYLRELEKMKRVVAVSGLSISKGSCAGSSEEASESDLTATVTAYVFTLPSPTLADVTTADADSGTDSAEADSTTDSATKDDDDE